MRRITQVLGVMRMGTGRVTRGSLARVVEDLELEAVICILSSMRCIFLGAGNSLREIQNIN